MASRGEAASTAAQPTRLGHGGGARPVARPVAVAALRPAAQDARFTRAIDRRIIDGYLQDLPAMVEELGRAGISEEAIVRRGESLGVTKDSLSRSAPGEHQIAARECLCCDRTFLSFGIQNRLCRRCRAHG